MSLSALFFPLSSELSPPFSDPIVIVGLAMVIFLTAPLVLQRYRLPGIVGIILVGAAIGPNALHLLERDATIQLLGTVGLLYLMFIAGLEINLRQFVQYKDRSIVFGLLSFLIPQAIGTIAGIALFDLSFAAASLFAAIFSSHTLLAYPIAARLGIVNNEAVTVAVGGTILTDTLALLVLAVVLASADGGLTTAFWLQLTIGLLLFFVGVWFIVPRIGQWFFRRYAAESYLEFLFVMVVLFACAFLAELAGVEAIIGAFLAGLALNRLIPERGLLMNRIEFAGNAIFIPFFLLSVGMLVDLSTVMDGPQTLSIAAALIGFVLITKFVAAWMTGRLYSYTRDEVSVMFGLSVGQAAAALAIVLIGFDAGIPGFDQAMINGVVLMILVISLASPLVVDRSGTQILKATTAHQPQSDSAQRILVPIHTETPHSQQQALLTVAMAIREPQSEIPIHVVSVVRPRRDGVFDPEITAAKTTHAELEAYGASVSTAIVSNVRINHNIASGIINASRENQISTIVIGWDGSRSRRQQTVGGTIDQLLARSSQLTLVTRSTAPLSTTTRIMLLLPPDITYNSGFSSALPTIARVAAQCRAPIDVIYIGEKPPQSEPSPTAAIDSHIDTIQTTDWKGVLSLLQQQATDDTLVVCLSARRDRIGWHPKLQTLPKSISTLTTGNFIIVYPETTGDLDDRQFFRVS